MNENNLLNEQETNTTPVQPVEPVQPAPVEPVAPVAPVQPEAIQPVESTEPIMPTEPSATTQIPVQPAEPLQGVVEQPPIKKKSKILPILIVFIIILLILCGASYYLFVMNTNNPVYNFLFNKNTNNNTTTTVATKLTEEEAKKLVLESYNKRVDDTLLMFNICSIKAVNEIDISSQEYKDLQLPEGNCNGYYQPVKEFKTIDDAKSYVGNTYTEELTNEIVKKFRQQNGAVYCCVPYTSYPIGNDNLTVDTIEIEATKISAKLKYTTGGDEMTELENHEGKISLKKVDNKWLIDSIE